MPTVNPQKMDKFKNRVQSGDDDDEFTDEHDESDNDEDDED